MTVLSSARSISAAGSKVLLVASVLVLAGLSIDLAGGRWGAYIPSPIPGVYLADLLVGLGALGALAGLKLVRGYRPILFVAFGLAAAYLAIRGLDSLVLRPAPDRYLVIRDLAPFGYLLLVPFMGIVLTSVSWAAFIWVVRIASSLFIIVLTLQEALGPFVPSFSVSDWGNLAVTFPGRLDLIGVVVGIAIVSWGAWPGVVRASRLGQFVSIVLGFNQESRAALLVSILCLFVAVLRERKSPGFRVLLSAVIVGPVVAIVFSTVVQQASIKVFTIPPQSPAQKSSSPPQSPAQKSSSGFKALDRLQSVDSSFLYGNRLQTWADLVVYVSAKGQTTLFWLGRGIGDPAALLQACIFGTDVEEIGLDVWSFTATSAAQIKCGVDSGQEAMPVRDPHNWFLNMMLYHGIVGTGIWLFGFGAVFWVTRRVKNGSLAVISIGAYFVCGTFQVIMSAPFALLPTAVFLAWLLSRYLLGGDNLRAPSSALKKPVTSRG